MLLRLGRLQPPEAAPLARALAVLEQAELRHATLLAEVPTAAAVDAADALAAAGILAPGRPLRFVHPIVRRAVYDELGGAERAIAHRRAARLLAEGGVQPERVVEHLLAADPMGDPWVVDRLREAAGRAAVTGASESAAVYLRRALAEPPGDAQRAGVLVELGLAEEHAGQGDPLATVAGAVESSPPGAARVAASLVLVHLLARHNRFAEAIDAIDRAAAAAAPQDVRSAACWRRAPPASRCSRPARASGTPRASGRHATGRSPRTHRHETLALAALVAVQGNEPAAVAAELALRAFAASPAPLPSPGDLPWFNQAAAALLWTGRHDELLPRLDAAVALARRTSDANLLGGVLAYRALGGPAGRRPQGGGGRGAHGAGLPRARRRGPLRGAQRGAARGRAHRAGPARRGRGAARGPSRGRSRAPPRRMRSCGSPAATSGWPSAGRRRRSTTCRGAGQVARRLGFDSPSWLPWRSPAAGALTALGEGAAARALAGRELELARAFGAPYPVGTALHAAGVAAGDDALLEDALDAFERAGARLARAHALTDLGALLRRGNRRAEARDLLREALDIAHRLGAGLLAERADTELRATGARPRSVVVSGPDSLTASERRVAELAAGGMTNRQIAQTLFVTPRTIEGHMTAVLRKLDLAARDGIGAVIAMA